MKLHNIPAILTPPPPAAVPSPEMGGGADEVRDGGVPKAKVFVHFSDLLIYRLKVKSCPLRQSEKFLQSTYGRLCAAGEPQGIKRE